MAKQFVQSHPDPDYSVQPCMTRSSWLEEFLLDGFYIVYKNDWFRLMCVDCFKSLNVANRVGCWVGSIFETATISLNMFYITEIYIQS